MSWFWNKSLVMLCLLCVEAVTANLAHAQINVNGFATLGYTSSNADDLVFRSAINRWPEQGSNFKTESVLGIQIDYQLSDKADIVFQSLLENKHYDALSDYFEMAFVRYQFNRNWTARAGRINYNAYLLSEYLHVGYSYLWAAPPMEYYTPSSNLSYIDGAEIQYRKSFSTGVLQSTLAFGVSKADVLNNDANYFFEYDYVVNGSVTYETDNWTLKGTLSQFHGKRSYFGSLNQFQQDLTQLPSDWWPAAESMADELNFLAKHVNYAALGYSYNDSALIIMAEAAMLDVEWSVLGNLAYGYVSLGYCFGELTPYITLAAINTTDKRKVIEQPNYAEVGDPNAIADLAGMYFGYQYLLDISRIEQSSVAIGLRWDFTANWALKAQLTAFELRGPGYGMWGSDQQVSIDDKRDVNVFNLNLNVIF
ncbi:hypothetical protein [Alteromonas sp. AMM-1]|uniref:hypothetical protein n=1 Tax=Alteromonas sp. AMM-1 TaxID=3394233 RepID=UPI0039A66DF9